MRRAGLVATLTVGFALTFGATVQAAEVIFSYTGGSATFQGGLVAGNTFGAASSVTFNSLGFIDVGGDGLGTSHDVGIWDTSTQTLLASTTVTPTSPLINGFRYASIPATTITGGSSFTIGALLPSSNPDAWMVNSSLILGPGFTGAGTGQFQGSGTLVYPATPDGATYVVANASTTVVPEPATLGVLAIGMLSLLGRRRR